MKKRFSLLLITCIAILMTACGKSEEAVAVENKINAIGSVSLDSVAAIEDAENAYSALTDKQKEEIENYSTLTSARTDWNNLFEKEIDDTVVVMNENFILGRSVCAKIAYIWSEYSPNYVQYLFMSVEDDKKERDLTRMNSTLVNDVYKYNCYEDILALVISNETFTEKDESVFKHLTGDKKEAYNDMFDAYQVVYQQATSPSGNYITYVQQINQAITDFETAYKSFSRY